MLLCQNFGGRHERNLISIFDGDDSGFERNDRFARSNISLQQTPHGERLFHVGRDFLKNTLLRRRGMKRQNLLDGLSNLAIQAERDAHLSFLLTPLKLKSQL